MCNLGFRVKACTGMLRRERGQSVFLWPEASRKGCHFSYQRWFSGLPWRIGAGRKGGG